MKLKLPERRRYIRIEEPLRIKISLDGKVSELVTKNISPVGVRFEIGEKLDEAKKVALALTLPTSKKPVRIEGKLIWQAKTSL
ncbi:MAG: PilZ domain-containing protein, partial [Candidatus Omnitrophota bacterium]